MAKGTVVAPFVYDGLQARMVEAAGFDAMYHTGWGNASSRGLPDVGLITLTEMTERIRILSSSADIPIISDADTGYGSYTNVIRTVREYEQAGAAALHIEDQVWPKRCGYMQGKQIIEKKEAANKIKAAVDARKSEKDLVIIARTDALAPLGWDAAEERARTYYEMGADMIFFDGIRTRQDVEEYYRRMSDIPCVFNNVPMIPLEEVEQYKFPLIIHPGMTFHSWKAMFDDLEALKKTGRSLYTDDYTTLFNKLTRVLGADYYFTLDEQYKNL
ncbi:MAG: isocitrate lyase/PEP mutase family protein [Bacillota bacterium]|nr:isocitrate lyase/PEP mutase family protein [Bacillota bacterium]